MAASTRVAAPSLVRALSMWKSTVRFEAENLGDFRGGFAARCPGEGFHLAVVEIDLPRPQPVACDAGKARLIMVAEHVEIDRLGHVIIGAQLAAFELVVPIGKCGEEYERHCRIAGQTRSSVPEARSRTSPAC